MKKIRWKMEDRSLRSLGRWEQLRIRLAVSSLFLVALCATIFPLPSFVRAQELPYSPGSGSGVPTGNSCIVQRNSGGAAQCTGTPRTDSLANNAAQLVCSDNAGVIVPCSLSGLTVTGTTTPLVTASGTVTSSGTPTNHQWPGWTTDINLKGFTVTASKPVCTDASGDPAVCGGTEGEAIDYTVKSITTPQQTSTTPDKVLWRGYGTNGRGFYLNNPAAEPANTFGLSVPTTEPKPGDRLKVLTFSAHAGQLGWTSWIAKTTTYTAVSDDQIIADTSGGAFTITLPATPTIGQQVTVVDGAGSFSTYNLTLGRNSEKINSSAADLVLNVANAHVSLVYYNSANGWRVLNMR
jgi:hypothetical protein